MSVSYYDKALYAKIQGWVKDKKVRVLGPDDSLRMFQLRADLSKDKPITLPCISISRVPNVELSYKHKKPMSFDGLMIAKPEPPEGLSDNEKHEWMDRLYTGNKAKSLQINAIPMTLTYQLDIYAKEQEMVDLYIREFIFNFINHPKMTVNIPYNGISYPHDCNVYVETPIQDNSDIPSRLFGGQFYRWTIGLIIEDAYLFSAPIEDLVQITDTEVEAELRPASSEDNG